MTTSPDEAAARLAAERQAVLERLAGLRGDRERFVEASRDSNADDEHDPEGHTIAYERSQVDTHVRLAEQRLAEIDAALERVAAGSYGVCVRCGRPIPAERLAVRPAASTCVACAAAPPS
ncbi:TraR/DksA family transcriptional regulator [Nocardioides sp. dk4132]|uniref:TraR/DksA family transcriptional regulator n=1 Tax=unclassified Nocardioides TaxID=2615069 RepID=UPI001294E8CF|nr:MULTISPECIES: TraR/DksA C4-type zinc finger protein [unclassified Nocardioides]MQW77865.1 TraR/DksA family transcriptional regulator [Nocardioides sp. dk4132]QGA08254.1 TraR/DksA family transcriptional regulator [Nocardioides sp. dk884]